MKITHLAVANMARLAAECAFDAHWQMEEMPAPGIAHDFIMDNLEILPDDPCAEEVLYACVDPRWWEYFQAVYNRRIANLQKKSGEAA